MASWPNYPGWGDGSNHHNGGNNNHNGGGGQNWPNWGHGWGGGDGSGDGKGGNGDGKGGGKDDSGGDKPTYDHDWYTFLVNQFTGYGLGSLAPDILKLLQQGVDHSIVSIRLQDTDAYKQRFAGNEIIKKAIAAGNTNLHVLSPGEYLAQEKQYRDVLSYYGLPQGFYDDPTDFASWIGGGVSVREIEDRARLAKDTVNGSPEVIAALRQYYPELGQGDITAFLLDQGRALPLIERKVAAANIGAGAAFQGLNVNRTTAEDLAAYGITADQARQGYSAIAEALPTADKLAALDHVEFGQSDLEAEVFKGDAAAAKKRKTLSDNEKARFGTSSAANQYSFVQDAGDF